MPSPKSTRTDAMLDMYACQSRLIWANVRQVEQEFLHSPLHAEKETICWFVQQGEATVHQGNRRVKATAGQWLLPADRPGTQSIEAGTRLISIRFLLRLRGGDPVFQDREALLFAADDASELEPAALRLARTVAPWKESESLLLGRGRIPLDENFLIEAAFNSWMSVYTSTLFRFGARLQAGRERDERVHNALMFLDEISLREKFSDQDVAEHCGVSVNQLGRLFKKEMGLSPFGYFDRRRMDTARHALAETPMQVKEVAFELGFSSSPHFSSWFKAREGVSPRQFRKAGK